MPSRRRAEGGRAVLRLGGLGAAALLVLVAALTFGAAVGETAIPIETVAKTVANRLWSAGFEVHPIDEGIVWNYRVARALVAASCGAALALCGVVLQALLRNPLADPYILGISAGASTGAVCVAILGIGARYLSLPLGAFAGALLAFALVAFLSLRAGPGPIAIILAGIAGSQLFQALTSLVVTKSATADQARGVMFWLLGSLSGVRWPDVSLAVPIALVGLALCLLHARALDAFAFGSEAAAALGVPVRRIYATLILMSAFLTATMVSLVGSIGFVGLVVPHAARLLVGPRHTVLLPVTALAGALFLIAADVASRTVFTGQVLPIGVMTALVGAPAFAAILLRRSGVR